MGVGRRIEPTVSEGRLISRLATVRPRRCLHLPSEHPSVILALEASRIVHVSPAGYQRQDQQSSIKERHGN